MSTIKPMTGSLHFLTVSPDSGSSDLALVGFIVTFVPAYPTVKVERLCNGKVEAARISIAHVTNAGPQAPAESSNGTVTINVPVNSEVTYRGGMIVWEFLIRSPAGGVGDVTFRISAGIPDTIPVEELGTSPIVNLQAAELNTTTPLSIRYTSQRFPRLAVGLNQAVPTQAPEAYRGHQRGSGDPIALASAGGATAENIGALLHQLFFQLDAPETLDPVWDQQTGGLSHVALSRSAFSVAPVQVAEELWARRVSEMLLLTVYSGVGNLYGQRSGLQDFPASAELFLRDPNAVMVLGFRCQDLATFGVASRGFRLPRAQLAAGSIAAALVLRCTPAGQWYCGTTSPQVEPKARSGRPHDLMDGPRSMDLRPLIRQVQDYGPPAVHLFSNPRTEAEDPAEYDHIRDCINRQVLYDGLAYKNDWATVQGMRFPAQLRLEFRNAVVVHDDNRLTTDDYQYVRDNQGSAHIAFMLRRSPESGQVQFFDTGALNIGGNDNNLHPSASASSNIDSVGTTTITSLSSPYKGTGIFPPLTQADAGALRDLVGRLAHAKPLGLARLAILDRSRAANLTNSNVAQVVTDGTLIYASPLLGMWGPEEDQSYFISRYLWSLRQMPASDSLIGVWMLYAPQNALASALVDAPRTEPMLTTARRVLTGADFPRALAQALRCLHDLVVEDSGTVQTLNPSGPGFGTPRHPLHALDGTDGRSTGILLPLDQAFPDTLTSAPGLPEYFRL